MSYIDKLKIIPESHINTSKSLSVNDFYNTPYMKPDMLTTSLTHLYGQQMSQALMLHQMTIGKAIYGKDLSSIRKIAVNTMEYKWPIMGRIFRNGICSFSVYSPAITPNVGLGQEKFFIYVDVNVFDKHYTIESPNEYQVRLISDGVLDQHGWRYEAVCQNSASIPTTELQGGVEWAQMFSVNSEEDSDETGHGYRVLPGEATNQINLLRASRSYKGNVANKKLFIDVPVSEGKSSKYWIEQDKFFFDLFWMKAKETVMMYGEYNKTRSGSIALTENNASNAIIRVGAGLLEQIPNTMNYTRLTYDLLRTIVMDIYFSNPLTAAQSVTLMTGQGGMEEFDRAMKDYLNSSAVAWNTTNDKIVQGQGKEMSVNGYFTKVYFIGGYQVQVVHNKMFDYGFRASKSEKHPVTNLPLESYRMIFLNNSIDNSINIQYVCEEGREVIEGFMPGMTAHPAGMPSSNIVVTPRMESSFHRAGTCGIALLNPCYSLHLKYLVA